MTAVPPAVAVSVAFGVLGATLLVWWGYTSLHWGADSTDSARRDVSRREVLGGDDR